MWKTTRNGNLLVEVDSQRQVENILKMKNFYTTKHRAYVHERLNTSIGVIRSRELAMATAEMTAALGKQGVINIREFPLEKVKNKSRPTSRSWHLINLILLKRWRLAIVLRGLNNVPISLRCFKCQKYGHHKEPCRGRLTCAKCSEKDLDHMEERNQMSELLTRLSSLL